LISADDFSHVSEALSMQGVELQAGYDHNLVALFEFQQTRTARLAFILRTTHTKEHTIRQLDHTGCTP
jgi:hypothetical protein